MLHNCAFPVVDETKEVVWECPVCQWMWKMNTIVGKWFRYA